MNGDGTQGNPYQITTFAELALYTYNDVGGVRYLKIMNDINISDEFPNNMPQLSLKNVDIDGDNKTISNWNRATDYMIVEASDGTYCKVHNLNFNNINLPATATGFMCGDNRDGFEKCSFRGQLAKEFLASDNAHELGPVKFKECVFKLKLIGSNNFNQSTKSPYFDSCYFECETNATTGPFTIYQSINDIFAVDSYFKIKALRCVSASFTNYGKDAKNCAIDFETAAEMNFQGNVNEIAIFNYTHAPNGNGTNAAGITDANWLDLTALAQAGFNVVPPN